MPWLMKAEPDSRIVKGKDVKFSVDDFEAIGTSPWDGVRNHEAKTIMRDKMKVGDKVLFYHSNCKVPGVFGLAEIAKEGYPDYTAWDPKHPYFDEKSNKDKPTWFMVDVKFIRRLDHPPTLALIKLLAASPKLAPEVNYIGEDGLEAIKGMQLVNRGRLSVQPVEPSAFEAVVQLGTQGGWIDLLPDSGKTTKPKAKIGANGGEAVKTEATSAKDAKPTPGKTASQNKKRAKAEATSDLAAAESAPGLRRSKRSKG